MSLVLFSAILCDFGNFGLKFGRSIHGPGEDHACVQFRTVAMPRRAHPSSVCKLFKCIWASLTLAILLSILEYNSSSLGSSSTYTRYMDEVLSLLNVIGETRSQRTIRSSSVTSSDGSRCRATQSGRRKRTFSFIPDAQPCLRSIPPSG